MAGEEAVDETNLVGKKQTKTETDYT